MTISDTKIEKLADLIESTFSQFAEVDDPDERYDLIKESAKRVHPGMSHDEFTQGIQLVNLRLLTKLNELVAANEGRKK